MHDMMSGRETQKVSSAVPAGLLSMLVSVDRAAAEHLSWPKLGSGDWDAQGIILGQAVLGRARQVEIGPQAHTRQADSEAKEWFLGNFLGFVLGNCAGEFAPNTEPTRVSLV